MPDKELPKDFDLLLDCKTQEQLQRKYEYAKGILDSIEMLLEQYPCIHVTKE